MHSPRLLRRDVRDESAVDSDGRPSLFEAMLHTAAGLARSARDRWVRHRQARATYLALCEIDVRTLRDLGLHPSELESLASEISGRAEPTRAHTAQLRHQLTA